MKRISVGGENDGTNNGQFNEAKNTTSPPRPRHDSATSGLRRAPDLGISSSSTVATTWPTYDQLVYIGINVPLPPPHQGTDSIRPTPDLIVRGTRPSPNSSPWVFCRTYHRLTEETARREEWSCHVTGPQRQSNAHGKPHQGDPLSYVAG
ncbi:hypothetical protein BHE74_00053746 [Ensete ventricosum]|nr:hypothetical protein BHE74_00053746 [Ensete ventricosum]